MLSTLPKNSDPRLIVGFDTADDAAVYKVNDETAIIQTVDFFPPMVDDPYIFGQVAAANALSDVYAMGGTPKLALNLFCFPSDKLPLDAIKAILAGGADKVVESGATLCGGHTIEDKEPKYGLAVTGFVHPDKVLANASAKEGDILILTKPIGSGIMTTAAKAELLEKADYDILVSVMTELNAKAQAAMLHYDVHSCTDITGFGFLGHLREMADGSKLTAEVYANSVPMMEAAINFAKFGIIPAGAYRNREFIGASARIAPSVPQAVADVLYDPQTAGGLLISVAEKDGEELLKRLIDSGLRSSIIGSLKKRGDCSIEVF